MGSVKVDPRNEIFPNTKELYIKELVTLNVSPDSKVILRKGEDIVLATTSFKKGRVMVLGDPWLYNEYVDGRRIPTNYQNFQATKDLAKWLLK